MGNGNGGSPRENLSALCLIIERPIFVRGVVLSVFRVLQVSPIVNAPMLVRETKLSKPTANPAVQFLRKLGVLENSPVNGDIGCSVTTSTSRYCKRKSQPPDSDAGSNHRVGPFRRLVR